jgi:hypothetical protein
VFVSIESAGVPSPVSAPGANIAASQHRNGSSMTDAARVWTAREMKFRQAAFVYLHAAILREASAYEMWRAGLLPFSPLGSPLPWLIAGAVVALLVFFGILRWQNLVFVRVVWVLDAVLLFPLIRYAFFAGADRPIPRSFYVVGIGVIVITLWMLARAAWDL